MGEFKHTKGPWKIEWASDTDIPFALSVGPLSVARNHWDGLYIDFGEGEEGIANARLIATSPCMYEALEKVSKLLGSGMSGDEIDMAMPELREILSAVRGGE